ncbi:MAG: hypothetical protein LJF06_03965 [Gemmatimonadetes bacterium]|nr:hypothetical protein [Gemmatimonadota bacterium]
MSRRHTDFPTGASRLVGLMLVAAVSACSNSQVTAPNQALPNAVDPVRESNLVVDPLDTLTVTHTFDELSPHCQFGDTLPNPYEGLSFESTPYYGACPSPNGTVALIPSNPTTMGLLEVVMDLTQPAVSASVDIYDVDPNSDVTLNAYDGSGNLVTSTSSSTKSAWVTLTVTGNFQRLGIAAGQGNTYIDNLTITSAPVVTSHTPNGGPTTPEECKNGGWAQFGFRNQGQCVSFVETGKRR